MKKGFTLAEILITLGIIGVVAAMTMPSLIANHRKKEVGTKLAKIYSAMNQAIKLSENDNGEKTEWELNFGTSSSPTQDYNGLTAWYNKYLEKYLTVTQKGKTASGDLLLYFPDGTILKIERCIYDMQFYLNAKALSKPVLGKNSFEFRFNPILLNHQAGIKNKLEDLLGKGFEPYTAEWDGTREDLFKNPLYGCKNTGGNFCTKLIQMSNWEIPDDYPVRF